VGLYIESSEIDVRTEMQIRGVAVSNKYCALFSEKSIMVYQINFDSKLGISAQSIGKECFVGVRVR